MQAYVPDAPPFASRNEGNDDAGRQRASRRDPVLPTTDQLGGRPRGATNRFNNA